jgi:hypothetical protein
VDSARPITRISSTRERLEPFHLRDAVPLTIRPPEGGLGLPDEHCTLLEKPH